MKYDEPPNISDTMLFIGKPNGKFYQKKFCEITQNDLEWLYGQTWLDKAVRVKLKEYLSKSTWQRAIDREKEGLA